MLDAGMNTIYAGLTKDQENALKAMRDWYLNTNSLVAVLQGDAGTGKTYLLRRFVRRIVRTRVAVTAPTHKAARLMEKMIGVNAKTLQSLHGLRPNFNLDSFDIDDIKFQPIADANIRYYSLIICDECSQIGTSLHMLNMRRARQYSVKILYVGDSYQLPPIGEKISPTFKLDNKFILTEIVRQEKDNPLIKAFQLLKEDIRSNGNNFIYNILRKKENFNSDGHGYAVLDKVTFQKKVIEYFKSEEIEKNINYVRYLAWTNKSINVWNSHIRNNILSTEDLVHPDDLFIGYKTIVDRFNNLTLINSEDYIVSGITKRLSEDNFQTYVVELLDMARGKKTKLSIVDHRDRTWNNYKNQIRKRHVAAIYCSPSEKSMKWRNFYEYKDFHLSLVGFDLGYQNMKKYIDKDIDYGYCITVHKSQGSTIDNVFINLIDICYYGGDKRKPINIKTSSPETVQLRNKLIYTAITRAKEKVYLLI